VSACTWGPSYLGNRKWPPAMTSSTCVGHDSLCLSRSPTVSSREVRRCAALSQHTTPLGRKTRRGNPRFLTRGAARTTPTTAPRLPSCTSAPRRTSGAGDIVRLVKAMCPQPWPPQSTRAVVALASEVALRRLGHRIDSAQNAPSRFPIQKSPDKAGKWKP
jgi:hypothetical protein